MTNNLTFIKEGLIGTVSNCYIVVNSRRLISFLRYFDEYSGWLCDEQTGIPVCFADSLV